MENRPGEQARATLIHVGNWAVRISFRVWLGLLACVLVLDWLILVLPVASTVRSFLLGFVDALAVACFVAVATLIAGSRGRGNGRSRVRRNGWSRGRSQEQNGSDATAGIVATGRRRRSGWRLVNGILLDGHGVIDHVLVGPGGVFAITSTWASTKYSTEAGSVQGLTCRELISEAKEAAQQVECWLRHGRPDVDVEVRPVLVIWGPGRIKFREGWERVDGVLVCDGPTDQKWLPQLDVSHLDQTAIGDIATALTSHVARQLRASLASGLPVILRARR